jgi:hypothetical protein
LISLGTTYKSLRLTEAINSLKVTLNLVYDVIIFIY